MEAFGFPLGVPVNVIGWHGGEVIFQVGGIPAARSFTGAGGAYSSLGRPPDRNSVMRSMRKSLFSLATAL